MLSLRLNKLKTENEAELSLIVIEMTESLIFDKLYMYLYMNITQFNKEEETNLKLKLKEPREINYREMRIDKLFAECNFNAASRLIKAISTKSTLFEKTGILVKVVREIEKEILSVFKKNGRTEKPSLEEDLIPLFEILIAKAEISNLLSEYCIMQYFNLKHPHLDYNEDLIRSSFLLAVQQTKIKYSEVVQTGRVSFGQQQPQELDFSFAGNDKAQISMNRVDASFNDLNEDEFSALAFKTFRPMNTSIFS